MGDKKARMFNKRASDPKNKPDRVLEALGLKKGQVIADIGSGGGYFSFRFCEMVGRGGKVYAVDTNDGFLKYIQTQAEKKGVDNLVTVPVTEDRIDLPKDGLDLIQKSF